MPYPLKDERDALIDMLPPNERMLFEALENQMRQTQIVLEALCTARWWAVMTSIGLAAALLTYAWALMFHC